MKITSSKFTDSYITDLITYQVLDLSESPIKVTECSVKFKAYFEDELPFHSIMIGKTEGFQGLSVNEWFKKILQGKRLGTNSEELEKLGGSVMLVNDTSPAYILSTFFQILKKLEPKLKSLKYVD